MRRASRPPAPALAAALATLLLVAVPGCGGDAAPPAAVAEPAPTAAIAPAVSVEESAHPRFFSPTSFWNAPLADDAPLDPRSGILMTRFKALVAAERQADRGPSVNTSRWSVPVYTVPANQPTVRVAHWNPNGFSPALQAAWNEVPLPSAARPAAGTDRHLVVWQPGTDRLWEFWRLGHGENGWWAGWGGAMRDVSANPGVYGPGAWPGATRSWGGSATSLSLAGGLIMIADLERRRINHALALVSPEVQAGVFSWPARRTDGLSTNLRALPEGARMRIDPDLDLDSLGLPPFTLIVARAAQRYGIVLRSQGGLIAFYGQDPTPTGTDPYRGPGGFFEGRLPNELLASFPWNHLQLLRMELYEAWPG